MHFWEGKKKYFESLSSPLNFALSRDVYAAQISHPGVYATYTEVEKNTEDLASVNRM